jgi:hypothetical protein
MAEKTVHTYGGDERRSEPRSAVDQYSSVEFSLSDLTPLYQFKIWETSPSGMSILVNEDSEILKHLRVGDILEMKYYLRELSEHPEYRKTEIKHITKDVPERVKGHFLIGLSVVEKENSDPE